LRIVENGDENIANVAVAEEETIRSLSIRGKIPRQTCGRCVLERTEINCRFCVNRSDHDIRNDD
jgi:hypothetical protein